MTNDPKTAVDASAVAVAGVFPADMAAKIQAVKDKYPKG